MWITLTLLGVPSLWGLQSEYTVRKRRFSTSVRETILQWLNRVSLICCRFHPWELSYIHV